jgi:hypothetical protein
LSGASAGACAFLVGVWWHRRRMHVLMARIARLQAEVERLRATRPVPRAEGEMRKSAPPLRPSVANSPIIAPHRRRFWPTMRSRIRALGRRRGSLSTALPFLDTVASTRHTAAWNDLN